MFLKNNEKELRKIFGTHHGVPCHVTIRDILQDIDSDKFSSAFNQRAKQYVSFRKCDTGSTDGKAIDSTASNAHNAYRNFVSPGPIFSASGGIVLHCGKIENKKEGEISGVQELITSLRDKRRNFHLGCSSLSKKRYI